MQLTPLEFKPSHLVDPLKTNPPSPYSKRASEMLYIVIYVFYIDVKNIHCCTAKGLLKPHNSDFGFWRAREPGVSGTSTWGFPKIGGPNIVP